MRFFDAWYIYQPRDMKREQNCNLFPAVYSKRPHEFFFVFLLYYFLGCMSAITFITFISSFYYLFLFFFDMDHLSDTNKWLIENSTIFLTDNFARLFMFTFYQRQLLLITRCACDLPDKEDLTQFPGNRAARQFPRKISPTEINCTLWTCYLTKYGKLLFTKNHYLTFTRWRLKQHGK